MLKANLKLETKKEEELFWLSFKTKTIRQKVVGKTQLEQTIGTSLQ